jgi:hypothetical protein
VVEALDDEQWEAMVAVMAAEADAIRAAAPAKQPGR